MDALRRLLHTLLELGQVRLALLGNELEEQKLRAGRALLLGTLGALLLTVAVLLLCALVLLVAGEQHRLLALALLLLAAGGGGALLLRAAAASLRSPGPMFQASIDELARDRERMGPPAAAPTPPPQG